MLKKSYIVYSDAGKYHYLCVQSGSSITDLGLELEKNFKAPQLKTLFSYGCPAEEIVSQKSEKKKEFHCREDLKSYRSRWEETNNIFINDSIAKLWKYPSGKIYSGTLQHKEEITQKCHANLIYLYEDDKWYVSHEKNPWQEIRPLVSYFKNIILLYKIKWYHEKASNAIHFANIYSLEKRSKSHSEANIHILGEKKALQFYLFSQIYDNANALEKYYLKTALAENTISLDNLKEQHERGRKIAIRHSLEEVLAIKAPVPKIKL